MHSSSFFGPLTSSARQATFNACISKLSDAQPQQSDCVRAVGMSVAFVVVSETWQADYPTDEEKHGRKLFDDNTEINVHIHFAPGNILCSMRIITIRGSSSVLAEVTTTSTSPK